MFKQNDTRKFQAGLDTEETRRRRQNDSLSLRRQARETILQKKRQRILARSPQTSNNNDNSNIANNSTNSHRQTNTAQLPKLVNGCFSNNAAAQFECTRQFRMLLSSANNPPIREVIDCGVIPRFIQFCRNNQMPQLQYESLWALLNIASGPAECTAHIIRNGSHNVFIDLLRSPLYEIRDQALWALGNIAGDGVELKDLLLNNHILMNIYAICSSSFDKQYVTNFNNNSNVDNDPFFQFSSLLSTASWTLSNLCRGSPPPKVEHLEQLIKSLHCLLSQALSITDKQCYGRELNLKNEIIMNVAWGFSYLTAYDQYQAQLVEKMGQAGIIQQFVTLMEYQNATVRHPINRLIGNILTGSDEQTKRCLNLGILSKYASILTDLANNREQREICWAISNICAGPIADKLLVLQSNVFPIMIDFLQNKAYECAKEALWAISNATTDHDKRIIGPLVDFGVIQSLCAFLRKFETNHKKGKNKTLLVALECIENILIVGQQHLCPNEANKFAILLEESGAVQYLEELQADDDNICDEVYEKCVEIIKKYFEGQEVDGFATNNANDQTLDYGHFNPYYQSNNNNNANNINQQNDSNNGQNMSNGHIVSNGNGNNNNNDNNGNGQFSFGVNSNSGSFGF